MKRTQVDYNDYRQEQDKAGELLSVVRRARLDEFLACKVVATSDVSASAADVGHLLRFTCSHLATSSAADLFSCELGLATLANNSPYIRRPTLLACRLSCEARRRRTTDSLYGWSCHE